MCKVQPTKFPCVTRPGPDADGNHVDQLREAVLAFDIPTPQVEVDPVDLARYMRPSMPNLRATSLTIQECLNGTFDDTGSQMLKGVEATASAAAPFISHRPPKEWPTNLKFQTKLKVKDLLVRKVKNGRPTFDWSDYAKSTFAWQFGDRTRMCIVEFYKSELLSKQKIDKRKVRCIFNDTKLSMMLQKAVFGPLLEAWARDPVNSASSVGINPHSLHWKQLYERMSRLPFNIDLDQVAADKHFRPDSWKAFLIAYDQTLQVQFGKTLDQVYRDVAAEWVCYLGLQDDQFDFVYADRKSVV